MRFTGGTGITSVSPQPIFQDVLITGDGSGTEATGSNGLQLVGGGITNNVAIAGFAGAGFRCDSGLASIPTAMVLLISGCGVTASGSFESNSGGGVLTAGALVVSGCGSHSLACFEGSVRRILGGGLVCSGHALNGPTERGLCRWRRIVSLQRRTALRATKLILISFRASRAATDIMGCPAMAPRP